MYRVTVACHGLTQAEGTAAVPDMLAEFRERPWQQNPSCTWDGAVLRFCAENDFDRDGRALLDEFWDAVHAYVKWSGPVRFEIETVEQT
jgi:hypothetical protein